MSSNARNQHAVVIGGSIAGLLAARVLSDFFEKVSVIERDPQPTAPTTRKGAPQGHHVHVLLKSGEQILADLFPGIVDDLVQQGAQRADFSQDVHWFHFGRWKLQFPSGFLVLVQSRPLLEYTIRHCLRRLPNVTCFYEHAAEALLKSADNTQVQGVRIHPNGDKTATQDLAADLVIDASGRGSQTPRWLQESGYQPPPETQVKIGLSYSTQVFQAPSEGGHSWKVLALNPARQGGTRAGYVFRVEGNRWLVTLGGYSGDKTPHTPEAFLEYAKSLAAPDIYEAIKTLQPISDIKVFNVPYTTRRHYEKLSRFPAGLVVLGDSFCVFDPVFGQGMSSAAKQANALRELLKKDGYDASAAFSQRAHRRFSRVVLAPWLLATSEDFRYPKTEGKKAFFIPFLHWYSGHVFALSGEDHEVYEAFRLALHLLRGPEVLFAPRVLWRVLRHALSGSASTAPEPR